MAQRMFHESGQDGRSVLGTLAVQVERDPRTGASVVRSVTPVSTPAGATPATTVFDDGRKSIHAVGGAVGQPSTEELGQILSVIDGVGMKVLLDEAEVPTNKAETEVARRAPEGKVPSFSACHAASEVDNMQFDGSRGSNVEAELGTGHCAVNMEYKEDKEDRSVSVIHDNTDVDNVVDERLVEGPVTLLFLGYTDETSGQGDNPEEQEGMITVERVMITEDGEEHVIGPETSIQEGKKSPEKVFQDVPLEENGAGGKVHEEDGEKGLHDSPSPAKAEGEKTSERKTCQCCSVM